MPIGRYTVWVALPLVVILICPIICLLWSICFFPKVRVENTERAIQQTLEMVTAVTENVTHMSDEDFRTKLEEGMIANEHR